jgi:hypothetical protein
VPTRRRGRRRLLGSVDPQLEIQELVDFDGRFAGTDAERRAAVHLKEKLERLGRPVEIEPIQVRPNWPVSFALLALLAVAGSVVAVKVELLGVVLLLVVTLVTFAELTGTFMPARALTPRRASQNVLSREQSDKPGTLVLMAHYDAARTGAVFGRRSLERTATLQKAIKRPIGPFAPFVWSMVLILLCAFARWAGVHALPLTVLQFIPTVLLIVSVPLLIDISLSGVVPGANDNASGVATVLRLAERFGGSLQHFDLWVLFPGAKEGLVLGSRAWIKRHTSELDARNTVFVNVDTVGHGTVRWVTKEGFVFPLSYHPELVRLCEEIGEQEESEARGVVLRTPTDGYSMRSAGFPAISIVCLNAMDYVPTFHQHDDTPENVDPAALERAFGFCSELVQGIDARVGPDLVREVEETVLSEG